jgi:glyoxylase-like metal-dependent hydrolase (beta-lactamase superfamily II)
VVLALAVLAASPLARAADPQPYPPLSKRIELHQVPGKTVYYAVGDPGVPDSTNEGFTSNAGFVVTTEGVIVFDALGTPSLGWDLLQRIREVTDSPVRYVIASHYHADHIYGIQAFKDHTEATVVAQERASEYSQNQLTADEKADQRLDQRRNALFPWVNQHTRVVPPDTTYPDGTTLSLGGKRFVLLYAGPAHSSSDIMMMVEPDKVLFAGDIVQSGRVPFMNGDDVDTRTWLKALDEVEKLAPTIIVPGHGNAYTAAREAIAFTRDYILFVRDAMQKATENWIDFDAAYAQTDWSKYKDLPAFENNNRGNAYRIYLEMEQSQLKEGRP